MRHTLGGSQGRGHKARALKPASRTHFQLVLLIALLLPGVAGVAARAEDHVEEFDETTVWRVDADKNQIVVRDHRLNGHQKRSGTHAEQLVLEAGSQARATLVHELPTMAHAIDELKLALQVQSYRAGMQVSLRLVFPYQTDPRSNELLTVRIPGDKYTTIGHWQELTAGTAKQAIERRIRTLRSELKDVELNLQDPMVDAVVLEVAIPPGTTELLFDNLRLGPIAPPQREEILQQTAGAEVEELVSSEQPPAEVRLGHIFVDGQPFFPRIAPDHGEDPAALAAMGINMVWVPNLDDQERLQALRENGIAIMATPPFESIAAKPTVSAEDSHLVEPFGPEADLVQFWYAGTRIPAEEKERLIGFQKTVRMRDKRLRRPIMADVTGGESVFGDHVEALGTSRHVINTSVNFKQYRNWLLERHAVSSPFAVHWTWLQTEPTTGHRKARSAEQTQIHIEPEQHRLQLYAALCSGCRGVGYWTTGPLTGDDPASKERRLAITQLNLEISLIEEILAGGKLVGHVPFRIDDARPPLPGQRSLDFKNAPNERPLRDAQLRARQDRLRRESLLAQELEATVIRNGVDNLVLATWYEHDAQFVPEKLAADKVSIVVVGAPESANAYEVSTTGIKCFDRQVEAKRVAGGLQIQCERFDQTAMLVVSHDPTFQQRMNQKIARTAAQSAQVSVELARAKLERVRQTRETLQSMQVDQLDAPALLHTAQNHLQQAEAALERAASGSKQGISTAFSDYDLARRQSSIAMQALRVLQRAFWDDAIRTLTSPVSSPHTVSFQTLPDHRGLLAQLGRSASQADTNILPSGDFESRDIWIAEGWEHTQNPAEGVHANAELHPATKEGSYALRLYAFPKPDHEPASVIARSPVTVVTPPMTTYSGQILHISGAIRLAAPIVGTQDGVMIYDNQAGVVGALRWKDPTPEGDWQRFEFIRTIQTNGDFRLTIALMGLGEVEIDDLKVIAHDPSGDGPAIPPQQAKEEQQQQSSPLRFIQDFGRGLRRQ